MLAIQIVFQLIGAALVLGLVALIQVVIGFLILLALIMATDFLVPGALDASSIA
ncbi:hypothetical protein ACMDCT_00030 [Halomonadaceae bacterium KBTZ08]